MNKRLADRQPSRLLIMFGFLLGAAMAGCAHKATIAGTWVGTETTPAGVTLRTTQTLTESGQDTISTQFSGPRGNNSLDGSGTYTVSGNTLTQTFTTLTINGKPVPRSKGPVAESRPFKLDGDTLTLLGSGNNPTQTLTRQKA